MHLIQKGKELHDSVLHILYIVQVDPTFEDVGWTIAPLFSHDGYVNSNIF